MRILLLVPMVPRTDGAGAIPLLLHAQLAGLAAEHEVTLVTTFGDEPGEVAATERLRAEHPDSWIIDRRQPRAVWPRWRRRARLAGSWLLSGRPWRTVWFADPGVQRILDRLTAEREFDVVAVEDASMSVFDLPAGVPAVLTEHEAHRAPPPPLRRGAPTQLPGRALRSLDWRRWKRFQRRAWARFGLLQVFSRGDAEAIAAAVPALRERLRVNPFGIELPLAADPAAEEPRLVVFVGNFTHPPNVDAATWLANEIMPAVRERVPDARLRIVGSSPPPRVRELAGAGVELVADAPSVASHLQAAMVVVAPVRTGGGMRMKVLEAVARGKAVVTTPLGSEGFGEFADPLPLAIADGAGELAATTAELLADSVRRRELGAEARAFAERDCSPAAWAERLERVYREAVGPAAPCGGTWRPGGTVSRTD